MQEQPNKRLNPKEYWAFLVKNVKLDTQLTTEKYKKMIAEEKIATAAAALQGSWWSRNWKKIENKLGILFVFAIIVMDQVWVAKPDWVDQIIFWLGIGYAFLTSETLQEALSKYSSWLEKISKTKAALAVAQTCADATQEELDAAINLFNEILANDPPEKRQQLIDSIKPLVNKLVDGRDALQYLCDTITEIDTN